MIELGGGTTGAGSHAEPFAKAHDNLKATYAEDRAIWAIFANHFAPDGADVSRPRPL